MCITSNVYLPASFNARERRYLASQSLASLASARLFLSQQIISIDKPWRAKLEVAIQAMLRKVKKRQSWLVAVKIFADTSSPALPSDMVFTSILIILATNTLDITVICNEIALPLTQPPRIVAGILILRKLLNISLVRPLDCIHDFRIRSGACPRHSGYHNRLRVANQNQRLSFQATVRSTIPNPAMLVQH